MKRSCRVPKIKVHTYEQFHSWQFSQVYVMYILYQELLKFTMVLEKPEIGG